MLEFTTDRDHIITHDIRCPQCDGPLDCEGLCDYCKILFDLEMDLKEQ
jgi:hypothetical protein